MATTKLFSYGEFEGDGVFDFSPETDFRFCVFSDLHHGYENYNVFRCTEALDRLQRIVDESKDCDFFLSLGDFADNLLSGVTPYEELSQHLHANQLRLFNGKDKLLDGERFVYNVLGNHETAYMEKSALSKFLPITEAGNTYAFAHRDVLFLAYDALFNANTLSDAPADILHATAYTLPAKVLDSIKSLLDENVRGKKSIVAFSHICLKCIEETAKESLLDLLLSYGLPVYIFDGHAHRENYQIFLGEKGNLLHAFTLPAVCDENTYNRYEVVMRKGELLRIGAYEKPLK